MQKIEVRNDDVLIYKGLTPSMKNGTRIKTFYEWFVEVDKWFEERNYPTILTVLADGIDVYPEWVEYIKQRQHRFKIELHGHTHMNYKNMSEEEAIKLLKEAKEKVEKTFNTKVTRWFAPFSKLGFPEWAERVCKKLDMGFHTKDNPIPHFYFHYWNTRSVKKIKWVIEKNLRGYVVNPSARLIQPKWLQTQEDN